MLVICLTMPPASTATPSVKAGAAPFTCSTLPFARVASKSTTSEPTWTAIW